MNSILDASNSFYNYSTNLCNTKDENANNDDKEEKGKVTGTVGIRRGNYICEYEVFEDGSRKFLLKIPIEKEDDNKNIQKTESNKCQENHKNQLGLISEYKENIRNASYKLNDKKDSLKDLIKMAY